MVPFRRSSSIFSILKMKTSSGYLFNRKCILLFSLFFSSFELQKALIQKWPYRHYLCLVAFLHLKIWSKIYLSTEYFLGTKLSLFSFFCLLFFAGQLFTKSMMMAILHAKSWNSLHCTLFCHFLFFYSFHKNLKQLF